MQAVQSCHPCRSVVCKRVVLLDYLARRGSRPAGEAVACHRIGDSLHQVLVFGIPCHILRGLHRTLSDASIVQGYRSAAILTVSPEAYTLPWDSATSSGILFKSEVSLLYCSKPKVVGSGRFSCSVFL